MNKLLGIGNTANVYEWDNGKVLKLFHEGYPRDAVEKEYNNAIAIAALDFNKPRAYKTIAYKNSYGIIYDKISGESLLDIVLKDGDINQCAEYMANIHRNMLSHEINNVPNYKDSLKSMTSRILSEDKRREANLLIDQLEDGNVFCHGDFHPGNIIVSEGKAFVIDFMNVCHGNYLYDIARTVFLIEYTPVPPETVGREELYNFKKKLSEVYLTKMNVSKDRIKNYLNTISIVRQIECPQEYV